MLVYIGVNNSYNQVSMDGGSGPKLFNGKEEIHKRDGSTNSEFVMPLEYTRLKEYSRIKRRNSFYLVEVPVI